MELRFTIEQLWYYGTNYGTMETTMVLHKKLWNYDLRQKKNHGRLPKTKKLSTIMERTMVIYKNN